MDFLILIIIVIIIIIIYWVSKWRPKKGIWYRNTIKSFNLGHLKYIKDCFIINKGKKKRGSFKVLDDKVLYIFGWKYKRNKIKIVNKYLCSFNRTRRHIPLQGQGTSEDFITTYFLTIN